LRTLFVGDVHGCSHELKKLLRKTRPTRVILTGDLFTRGPDPRGVWKLIRRWEAEAVMGNQDAWALDHWRSGEQLSSKATRWLSRLPYLLHGRQWTVVHAGINPISGPWRTRRRQALNLRRWPDDRRSSNPYWWRLWSGPRLIVHGHHPHKRPKDRRPYTLGLDTDCVRGGTLSGYLLEDDELVRVQARRDYTER